MRPHHIYLLSTFAAYLYWRTYTDLQWFETPWSWPVSRVFTDRNNVYMASLISTDERGNGTTPVYKISDGEHYLSFPHAPSFSFYIHSHAHDDSIYSRVFPSWRLLSKTMWFLHSERMKENWTLSNRLLSETVDYASAWLSCTRALLGRLRK